MIIGIDLGGTKVAAGVVSTGRVVRFSRRLTEKHKGKAHVIRQIRAVVAELSQGERARVGIAVPGYYNGSRVAMLPNLRVLDGTDLGRALKLPVRLMNDAKAFGLGEARFGAGKGKRTVVALTLGTGLGSAVVIDGELLTGKGAASHRGLGGVPEIGHLIFDTQAKGYREGQHMRDWESLLSGPAIMAMHQGREERASEIWSSSSTAARKTRATAARHLAILAANVVRMYGPDVIILGGGVATAGLVRDANELLPRYGCRPILKLSKLREKAAILGAASLY